MADSIEISRVACGCIAVRFHESSCNPGKSPRDDETVFCDTEDGSVWLHTPHGVTALSGKRARHLGDELHVCAHALEKSR